MKTDISCTPMTVFSMGRKVISMTHVGKCTIHASYRNISLNTTMQIHICRCPICLRGLTKKTPGPTKCGRYSPTPSEKFLIPSTIWIFPLPGLEFPYMDILVDQTSAVSTCTSQKVYHLVHRDPYPVFNIIPIKLGSTIPQIQRCGQLSTFGKTTLHGRWKIIQPCVQDGPQA